MVLIHALQRGFASLWDIPLKRHILRGSVTLSPVREDLQRRNGAAEKLLLPMPCVNSSHP